jgi:LacI family gluconate utilization system Gnt-I transcriptional repressor
MPTRDDAPAPPDDDDSAAGGRRGRRSHGRATLADVAAQAEVTKITVSRFLREPARVAPATAERIRAALAATGYVPNKQAGLLASGRSRIVAAIVPNLSHSIFGETVQALTEALQPRGLELLLSCSGYDQAREEEQLRAVLGWAPAAVVLTGRHHTPATLALLREARRGGTPVIEMWDMPEGGRGPGARIGFDHAAVGRAMADHLLAAGRRRLAYLDSGVTQDFRAHERGEAFVQRAREAGARAAVLTAATGDSFDAGRAAFHALRDRADGPPDAVACANDRLACGLLMEAQAYGWKVPQELAVLGFGDFPVGRQIPPTLSTVRPPSSEIGEAAAAALLSALDADAAPKSRALPWQLIVRGSTAGGG